MKDVPHGTYAIGFDSPVEQELSNNYSIEDIPALVLLKDGKVATTRASERVTKDPENYPGATIPMASAFDEDEVPICVLFEESCSAAETEAFVELAKERICGDWKFVRVAKDAGLSAKIPSDSDDEASPGTTEPTETSDEDEAIASLRSFLTRQYTRALSHETKMVAVSGSRRQAWGFGWDGAEKGTAEITLESAGAWLDGIDSGDVGGVPARTLSDSEEESGEDDNDSDWEEEDTDEEEDDEEAFNATLEMLLGGMEGDRKGQLRQLRQLLAMLEPGSSMGGAGGGLGVEDLLSGMRAANIEEVGSDEEGLCMDEVQGGQLEREQIAELKGSSASESEGRDVKGKRVSR